MHWGDVLIGAVIGVFITFVVGYWFYVLQNRRNAPLLAFRSFSWALATQSADATDPDLVIWFRGVAVPRLTRTQIALWNPGRTVIQEADISDVDPLEFGFRHGKVLEARLVRVARSASKVEVSTVNERARVSFDFLDYRDGLLIDVLHTDERGAPVWSGTIKGLPEGIRNFGHLVPQQHKEEPQPQRILSKGPAWFTFVVDMVATYGLISGVFLGPIVLWRHTSGWGHVGVVTGTAALVAALAFAAFLHRRRFAIPSSLMNDSPVSAA